MKLEDLFRERFAIIILVVLFILLSAHILRFPHDTENAKGTIPDEQAFYVWGEIYLGGEIAVPVSDSEARYNSEFTITDGANIYADVGLSDLNNKGGDNDVFAYVYDLDGPISNATVVIEGLEIFRTTGEDGYAYFYDLNVFGRISIIVIYQEDFASSPIKVQEIIEVQGQSGSYSIYAEVDQTIIEVLPNGMARVELTVTVSDIFGNPVEGANVRVMNLDLGETDDNGEISSTLALPFGNNRIIVEKEGRDELEGLIGCTTTMDGEYVYANRWPPGFPYLLGIFTSLGIEMFVGVFVVGVSTVGVYLFTRRFFNWQGAFFAATLTLFTGDGILQFFSRYMADYASAGFAFVGFYLMAEAFLFALKKRKLWVTILLGMGGGLMMGWSVTMRYSAVVLIFAPALFLLLRLILAKGDQGKKEEHVDDEDHWEEEREEEGEDDDYWEIDGEEDGSHRRRNRGGQSRRTRSINSDEDPPKGTLLEMKLPTFKACLKTGIPFLVGLLIMGSLLMWYNTALFGGPFNSGYQRGHTIEVTSDPVNGTSSEDLEQPSESFFEQYFEYQEEDVVNIPRIFSLVFYLIPAFFIAPLGVFLGRKKAVTWSLALWIFLVFLIYLSQGWAGSWEGDSYARTLEDMRYYMPIVAPCCILAGAALGEFAGKSNALKITVGIVVVLLIISGLVTAGIGIDEQLSRLDRDAGLGKKNQPSGDQPPGDQPPGDQPPGDQPPGDQPPGDQPPGGQPPGDQPPGNLPPPPGTRAEIIIVKMEKPRSGDIVPPLEKFHIAFKVSSGLDEVERLSVSLDNKTWIDCRQDRTEADIYHCNLDLSKMEGKIKVHLKAESKDKGTFHFKYELTVEKNNQKAPPQDQQKKDKKDDGFFNPLFDPDVFLPAKICIILALLLTYGSFIYWFIERKKEKPTRT